VTDISVVSPELPGNAEVRVGVGVGVVVGVSMGVIVDRGSGVETPGVTDGVVVTEVTGLPDGTGSVVHPVTGMKKMREIIIIWEIFIV
jgi:hypothetical protein